MSAAEDAAGDFVAGWVTGSSTLSSAGFVQAIAADNTPLAGIYEVTSEADASPYNGSMDFLLAANPSGLFFASWYQSTGSSTGNFFGQLATIQ